jgi:biopolymer transport protein ExbD
MEFEGRTRIATRLDMTPLIDVVFLLLIFFLLTSSYVVPQAIGLKLPRSRTAEPTAPSPVVVVLRADGRVVLDGRPLSLEALTAALRAAIAVAPDRAVSLESDADVSVQRLLSAVDAIRDAGGRSLSLATRREGG